MTSYFSDYFVEHLRLDQEDVSAGRLEQYGLFSSMLANMDFWGMGYGRVTDYILSQLGQQHSLHNTYMRNIVEFGWLYGLAVIFFTISLFVKFFKSYRKKKENVVFWGAIIISGLLTAMFEPGAIFGYLGGACLWWFSLGVFLHMYRMNYNKIINI